MQRRKDKDSDREETEKSKIFYWKEKFSKAFIIAKELVKELTKQLQEERCTKFEN